MIYDCERFLAYLEARTIPYEYDEHPPLHTIEIARAYRQNQTHGFAKNLLIHDRRDITCLLTCPYDTVIDLKKVRDFLATRRLTFVPREQLLETLHIPPGCVSPLALINARGSSIRFLIDQALATLTHHHFHPLDACKTLTLRKEHWVSLVEEWGFDVEWIDFTRFLP